MSDTTPSYEQARDELIAIVAKLEAGNSTLAESMELWERGETLAKIAQQHLDGARAKLDAAHAAASGGSDQE
ncbi:MAG: exodeoxyribonuclease VII small subunit [Nocardioidaceae bacterium]|nr:exodeoxyribonuclease VII small subunit [Nocardioidaceae bacterium]